MKRKIVIHLTMVVLIAATVHAVDCDPRNRAQFAQSGQPYTPDINTVMNTASEIRIEESLDSRFTSIVSGMTWRRSEGTPLPQFVHYSGSYRVVYHRVTALFPDGSSLGGCTWTGQVAILDGEEERLAFGRSIIPVAGSLSGANGARFRTALTLYNPFELDTLEGAIVFHPAGRSGLRSDPSIRFSLRPGAHIEYSDIVEAIGATGLGSLDIIPDNGLYVPAAQATIYNDAGNGAAFGMSVPQIKAGDLDSGVPPLNFIVPSRAEKRVSIGLRTGPFGGSVSVSIRRPDGTRVDFLRDYPADYFIQSNADDFLGVALAAGDQISIYGVDAVVYVTETNNVTNDPQILIPFANTSDYFVGGYFR